MGESGRHTKGRQSIDWQSFVVLSGQAGGVCVCRCVCCFYFQRSPGRARGHLYTAAEQRAMERKQEENCGARREVNKQNLRHLVLLVSKETLFFFEPLDGAGVVVEGAVRAFLRGKEGEKKIDVHNSIVIIRVVAHRKGYSQRILQISSQIDNNERHGLIRVLLFLRMSMRRIAINLCAHKQWYRDG